jgi:hypothetical protein
MILFLDFYHPYAGLCNQLYLITNHIHSAYLNNQQIYINKFNIDIFNKKRIPASGIFDLEKTQENLIKLLGTNVLTLKKPKIVENIPRLCIYPVSSVEILNALEFNSVFKTNKKFENGVHFRLDTDCILHYTFGENVYNKFMDLANTNEQQAKDYFLNLNRQTIENYCNFLIGEYIKLISEIGFEKEWYICTSVGKDPLNIFTKGYLDYFTNFIESKGGKWYITPKQFKERELNALVDLLVLRDCKNLIVFEGSSFSEGYCLKVNQIRNTIQNYKIVKINEI